jgi:hypothetical protein
VAKFNAATNNALILRPGSNHGDYVENSFYAEMPDMIKHRNPRADAALSDVTFTMERERTVKVGRTAGPVKWDDTQLAWIKRSPDEAGTVIGFNFAEQKFRKYFDLMISILVAAMSNDAASLRTDVTAAVGVAANFNLANMNTAMSKFGEAYTKLGVWLVHSKPMFDLFGANLTNTANLFEFAGVRITTDHLGKPLIMSDSPSLVNTVPNPDQYRCLCLTPGSIIFEENNDYKSEYEKILGRTNLGNRWQAEWSFNASVKGYSWDAANGGTSPNDAALVVATNWDNVTNTHKNLPGVELLVI